MKTNILSVDAWEAKRLPRRHDEGLLIGWRDRTRLLNKVATTEEMIQAMHEAISVRNQRRRTLRLLMLDRYVIGWKDSWKWNLTDIKLNLQKDDA